MVNQMKKIAIISMILLLTPITCDKRESSNGVKIYVDPRIEFISIVFSMTSWDRMIDEWLEHEYKHYAYFREIEKTFHPFRSHDAIMIAESLVVKHKFYNVVLAPCMHPMGGYGLRIPDDDNYHSYEVVRVDGIQNDFPSLGKNA